MRYPRITKHPVDPRPIQDLLSELGLKDPTCRSVLLVDDEFEVLAVLEALLDDEWDVHTAQGGREALAILDSGTQIDVVITDQRMPEMTGVELESLNLPLGDIVDSGAKLLQQARERGDSEFVAEMEVLQRTVRGLRDRIDELQRQLGGGAS